MFNKIRNSILCVGIGLQMMAAILDADQVAAEKAARNLVRMFVDAGANDPKQFIVDGLTCIMREVWRVNNDKSY